MYWEMTENIYRVSRKPIRFIYFDIPSFGSDWVIKSQILCLWPLSPLELLLKLLNELGSNRKPYAQRLESRSDADIFRNVYAILAFTKAIFPSQYLTIKIHYFAISVLQCSF